ncbi:MAG: alpha/beta fold hydrolase [Candidatus Hydrogenedentes bacterium]|nr:alpha/beta fold hydrolase [Candidatus Hydrogenedentota bacterium]
MLIALLMGCSAPPSADPKSPKTVYLDSDDGYRIAVDLYLADGAQPPALILVHMLGSDRHAWRYFARRAQARGYTCAAFDMRGHGDSAPIDGSRTPQSDFEAKDWLSVLNDIQAVKALLLESGANSDYLAIIGASIGANLALRYAVRDADIQTVILLSPGLDYRGVTTEEAMQALRRTPVMIMSGDSDRYAATSSATLDTLAPGYSELRAYPGSAHGTDLLDTSDTAVEQIFQWLETTLNAQVGKTGNP